MADFTKQLYADSAQYNATTENRVVDPPKKGFTNPFSFPPTSMLEQNNTITW